MVGWMEVVEKIPSIDPRVGLEAQPTMRGLISDI